ncbi:MAG: RsfS/YbeB/iojap family protein [Anaerotruncus colihominis]
MTSNEMVKKIARFLSEKKAKDIMALEIRELTTIGDYFVIASGGSDTQVKALSDAVEEGLSALGEERGASRLSVGDVDCARLLR